MPIIERHDERCPTCGRFVEAEADGFYDLPPGGVQNIDYLTVYCDKKCADGKKPPCIYEDDPGYAEVTAGTLPVA